ncbi:MAG TPA: helix-hairpin-helix domain-containing protein [Gemmatimonadales bacterium]|nr:helix-hairpin-helix domain-containing protein [Gemmatimonadales bacterium]
MAERLNAQVAGRLDEVARLLAEQGANPFRGEAYARAAETLRRLAVSVTEILESQGLVGLEWLPGIGPSIARSIRDLATTGRLPMLERLRGESDPLSLLGSVPGVGEQLAQRLHHDLDIDTLEELEAAAHDGRLEHVAGIGPKRLAGTRDALATRLGRLRRPAPETLADEPSVEELLSVDREYRTKGRRGELKLIAPRRFNPTGKAWLPILHTKHGERDYTALFSNTARAHQFGRTQDWVVVYVDGARTERQYTVVTARRGVLKGKRAVRGREVECAAYYAQRGATRPPAAALSA